MHFNWVLAIDMLAAFGIVYLVTLFMAFFAHEETAKEGVMAGMAHFSQKITKGDHRVAIAGSAIAALLLTFFYLVFQP